MPRVVGSGLAAIVAFCGSLLLFDRAATAALDRASRWIEGTSPLQESLARLPGKSAYQVLVLGSSRTFEAVHPAAIERVLGVKAYKEASRGKGLRYAYEFYLEYRKLVGKPRVVVYGVDYFMFGNASEATQLRRLHGEAHPAAGVAGRWTALRTLADKDANDRAIVRILERAQRRFVSAMGEFDPDGNQADMAAYTGRVVSRVVPRPEPAHFAREPYARFPSVEGHFLMRLLDACAADRVTMMFVYPPDYEATRRTNFEHDRFVAEFRRLIAGRPDTFFHDYDDPLRFAVSDPALFWDGDWGNPNSHLSQRGAEAFARLYLPDLARALASAPPSPR